MHLKRAPITQAGAGTDAIIAAPGAGLKIHVWGFTLVQASGTATLKSATTALTGAMPGGLGPISPAGPGPILECAENEALNLVTTAAAAYGEVRYQIVPSTAV